MGLSPERLQQLAERALPEPARRTLASLSIHDAGHGFDRFGLSRAYVGAAWAALRWLYTRYFRVESVGGEALRESLPRGPFFLAANHSGTLPFDAVMLWLDALEVLGRVLRPVGDLFVSGLPYVGTIFQRGGMVAGSPATVEALLSSGEAVLVFPEGVPGIAKPFWQRYRLRPFRVGPVELSLRYRVPIVPVAVIGAEEQMPQLFRLKRVGRVLGVPHIPVPLVPVPLPVRYHIHYGEPLRLFEGIDAEAADDPRLAQRGADRLQREVQRLVDEGLRRRRGVFR